MQRSSVFLVTVFLWVSNYDALGQTTNLEVGLLVPVTSNDPECNQKANNAKSDPVIILEAYRFGIEKANQELGKIDINLHPRILPFCNEVQLLYRRTVNITMTQQTAMCTPGAPPPDSLIAVVGKTTSDESKVVTSILEEICVPLISSYATNPDLPKRPYFVNTLPTDDYQATFLWQILKFMNATPAVIVYDSSSYAYTFVSALRSFSFSDPNGFSVENEILLGSDSDSEYENIIRELEKSKAVAVVLLMAVDGAQNFFRYLQDHAPELRKKFQFLGPDGWGGEYSEGVPIPESTIGVMPYLGEDDEFREYLTSITLEKACRENKMELAEVIAEQKKCTDPCGSGSTCDKSSTVMLGGDGIGPLLRAKYFIQSITQLKDAILLAFSDCNSASNCPEGWAEFSGYKLVEYMKQSEANATYGLFTFSEDQHTWQYVDSYVASASSQADMSQAFLSSPLAVLKLNKEGTLVNRGDAVDNEIPQ